MTRRKRALCAVLLWSGCTSDTTSATGSTTVGSETGSETGETGACPDEGSFEPPACVWRVVLASELDDVIADVAVDTDGNVHVVGWVADLEPSNQNGSRSNSRGFVTVFSPTGEQLASQLWECPEGIDGASVTRITDIEVSVTGERYLAGHSNGSLTGEPSDGSDSPFVAALSPDGSLSWFYRFDAFDGGYEVPQALTLSPRDELILAWGVSESETPFGLNLQLLSRLSSAGELQAQVTWDAGGLSEVSSIDTDCAGDVLYVVGSSHADLPGQAFLARFDREFDLLEAHLWTGELAGSIHQGVTVTDAGVYVHGEEYGGGQSHGFIARYDLEGTLQWSELSKDYGALAANDGLRVVSNALSVFELLDEAGEGWSATVSTLGGGEVERIEHLALGPAGEVAAVGVVNMAGVDHDDAFVALLRP